MGNLKDRVARLFDAYKSQDWDALGELCADDVEHAEPLMQPLKGRQAVLEFVKQQKATFPDSTLAIKRIVEEGDIIVTENPPFRQLTYWLTPTGAN